MLADSSRRLESIHAAFGTLSEWRGLVIPSSSFASMPFTFSATAADRPSSSRLIFFAFAHKRADFLAEAVGGVHSSRSRIWTTHAVQFGEMSSKRDRIGVGSFSRTRSNLSNKRTSSITNPFNQNTTGKRKF